MLGVRVENLSKDEIDRISREIGDAFFDHKYGKTADGVTERGLCRYITDRQAMHRYIKAIFTAGLKSGLVYSTSERGEGYILITSTKGDTAGPGAMAGMIPGMLGAFGFRNLMRFGRELKRGGLSLEDRMKRERRDFLKLEMLVVRKEYQGQGYMRRLMDMVFEKADAYHVPVVFDTDAENKLVKYCHLGMKLAQKRVLARDCILYDMVRNPK